MPSAELGSNTQELLETNHVLHEKIFISHSSADAELATEICAYLESRGIICWIAPRDISPGDRISESIDAAIAGAAAVVVLVSAAANGSQYVSAEVELAFNYKRLIVPVRIGNVAPSSRYKLFLGGIHRIDAFEEKKQAGIEKLYATLRRSTVFTTNRPGSTEISHGASHSKGRSSISRRNVIVAAGSLLIAGGGALTWFSRDTHLSSSRRPLRAAWTKRIALVAPFGDPFAAVAVANGLALVAAQQFADESEQLLALRVDGSGATTGRYLSPDLGSAGHAVLPAADGGAWVGGGSGSKSLLVRLDRDWKPLWSQTYGEGSITAILPRPTGVIAGMQGPELSGTAKLLFVRANGMLERDATLLDRQGDSVQGVVLLPDGDLAVLGLRAAEGRSGLWVSRASETGEIWRTHQRGLGFANGWDIVAVNDKIYVAGRTSPDGNDDSYQAFVMRIDAKSGEVEWYKPVADKPASGRALAVAGSGSGARLYMAGWAGKSKTARLSQIGPIGELEWDQRLPGQGATNATGLALAEDGSGFGIGLEAPNNETLHLTLTRFT